MLHKKKEIINQIIGKIHKVNQNQVVPLIDNITNNKKLAKEIIKQLHEYNDQHTFLGWDMVLKKFTLKKFK